MAAGTRWLIAAVALVAGAAWGQTAGPKQRAERIEKQILAPCCYKQTIFIHNSEICVKMKLEIARWIAEGRTDREILETYAGRYGAKVLVDPDTLPRDWMYLIPWLALVLGGFGLAWMLRRWHSERPAAALPEGPLPDLPEME